MPLPADPTYTISSVSEDARDEVNRQIMVTGLERECRKTVASLRPSEKQRFNGDTERFDFDTVKKSFERAMNQPGITDEIQITELNHWFSGVALGYIELHKLEEDPATQLELIWCELNEKYGKRADSVDNLLRKIIEGPEVKSGDHKAIDLFTIELKKFDIIATKTDRCRILDCADTINRIIRDRMPNAVPRWAKKIEQALDRQCQLAEGWILRTTGHERGCCKIASDEDCSYKSQGGAELTRLLSNDMRLAVRPIGVRSRQLNSIFRSL